MTHTASTPLLAIEDLAVSFESRAGRRTRAVDGVSLTLHPGQTLAVVGESGSGKSVTALSVLRLLPTPPARYDRGRILVYDGVRAADTLTMPDRALRRVRGGVAAMIFQEPMTSLNPVYTIGEQVIEAVLLHQCVSHREASDRAVGLLEQVGLPDARRRLRAYPHEFSGGMRQRVMIAIALACGPRLLLADEPTTALDVTIQAQILDLLRELKAERGLGIMLISHALNVVARHADAVCVMYGGRVVEYASTSDLFRAPLHPYTRALIRCTPNPDERRPRLETIDRIVDDPAQFARLPAPWVTAIPWWPHHAPPRTLVDSPAGDFVLLEIEPRHWVGLWRTEDVAARTPTRPDVPPP